MDWPRFHSTKRYGPVPIGFSLISSPAPLGTIGTWAICSGRMALGPSVSTRIVLSSRTSAPAMFLM